MRLRPNPRLLLLLALFVVSPLRAQSKLIDIANDLLDRFLKGATAEQAAQGSVQQQLTDLDAKIKSYHDCESLFLAAQNATSSATLGFAAKAAMRLKCGATSDDDLVKQRNNIIAGPLAAGAKAGGFGKVADYQSLKDKIVGYLNGDRSSFTPNALNVLAARSSDLSSALGVAAVTPGSNTASTGGGMSGGGMMGGGIPAIWTADFAWVYIGQLFALQYASGATMFEKVYKPGEWTRWEITVSNQPDGKQTVERAFLGVTPDGGEWWRMKTIMSAKQGGKDVVDTIVLEGLYKPVGQQIKQLVRMRGKLPGNTEPQELLVPAGLGMINSAGIMPFKPTPESIDGATVGTESVSWGGGSSSAKHVRFGGAGGGGGSIDWWLTDDVPGGWVKFSGSGGGAKKDSFVMQMVGKGTGATSELGVKM